MNLAEVRSAADAILVQVRKAVVGQDEAIELLLNALFCGGHVLIEGVPGTAKTLLAQSFAASLALRFGRVQFTPDLMPGDLLGRQSLQLPDQRLLADAGADLHRHPAGRRNQPHAAQDPGRAAAGDERTRGDHRRRDPSAWRRLHGRGDAKPDRAAGDLSAARSAARPLSVQDRHRLSPARRRARDRRAARPSRADASPAGVRPRSRHESGGLGGGARAGRDGEAAKAAWSTISSTSCAPRAKIPTWRRAPRRAPRPCWPPRRARMPRSTGATSSFPTT